MWNGDEHSNKCAMNEKVIANGCPECYITPLVNTSFCVGCGRKQSAGGGGGGDVL